jgi:Fe-Mn family superoxide dismutase
MYTEKEFTIPELTGISKKNIEEHLGLYKGYVANTNKILKTLEDGSVTGYALSEMHRRLSFELGGVKNHELYFSQLEEGPEDISNESSLMAAIENQWGSFESWREHFETLAKTRGVGWAMMGYDKDHQQLLTYWVDEQHLGHLNSISVVFALDLWEHAYVGDYSSSGKGSYIKDYLDQVNWGVVEKRFNTLT